MASPADVLRYVWNFVVFFVTNVYGLFAYAMWMGLLVPLRYLSPSLHWKLESYLFKGLQSFIIVWMGTGGYQLIESGDDISSLTEKEVLLLCNHQSTADTPLVMMALWGKGQCMNNCMWIMDWVFKFTNFGIISMLRKDVFIKQGKETRELQGIMLKNHLKDIYLPHQRKWIILFPEGGFLHKRLESSQNYARKNGYPVLNNVTLPRIGALAIILDSVGGVQQAQDKTTLDNGYDCKTDNTDPDRPLKWIVDMTIGYRNKEGEPPDMLGMCVGYRVSQNIHVHYRAYPLSDVPREGEEQLKWFYDRYAEKDTLLDYFNTHGHFPPKTEDRALPDMGEQRVVYDWTKVALIQAFYLASFYFHYTCIVQPLMCLLF